MNLAFLRKDVGLKLLALAIGTSLYVYVQSLEINKTQRQFTVRLRTTSVPTDILVEEIRDDNLDRLRSEVSVTVKGPADEILQLDDARLKSRIAATVDLSGAEPGEKSYPIRLAIPGDLASKFEWTYEPRSVTVATEKLTRLNKQVTVVTTGTPRIGQDYGSSVVEPNDVEVVGAQSRLAKVKLVRVLLDLEKAISGVATPLTVELLDESERPVDGVTANPDKVVVTPVLTPSAPWRPMFVAPSFVGRVADGHRVSGYKVTPEVVELVGDPRVLKLSGTLSTSPIDLTNQAVSFERTVELIVPRGLRLKKKVQVRVQVDVVPDPAVGHSPSE